MANYINQEILCEAYTHLDIENFSDQNSREKLEAEIKQFIEPRAEFIFGEKVEVKITFDDGSLKTKIAILGVVAGLITQYNDFKDGIESMSRDAIVLAQAANLEVIFKTRTANCDRIRIEKRSGVLGRVNHLINSLEKIKDAAGHSRIPSSEHDFHDTEETVQSLLSWQREANTLMEKLESNETKACIASGLLEELEHLPDELGWVEPSRKDSFRARILMEDIELASTLDGLAAQYARILAITKEYMLREIKRNATDPA